MTGPVRTSRKSASTQPHRRQSTAVSGRATNVTMLVREGSVVWQGGDPATIKSMKRLQLKTPFALPADPVEGRAGRGEVLAGGRASAARGGGRVLAAPGAAVSVPVGLRPLHHDGGACHVDDRVRRIPRRRRSPAACVRQP